MQPVPPIVHHAPKPKLRTPAPRLVIIVTFNALKDIQYLYTGTIYSPLNSYDDSWRTIIYIFFTIHQTFISIKEKFSCGLVGGVRKETTW